MFVVILKFKDKSKAAASMEAHNDWIAKGFEDGVFLTVGTLQPSAGGAIVANGLDRAAMDQRLSEDPFIAKGVVSAEIFEILPARTDPRLDFLKE